MSRHPDWAQRLTAFVAIKGSEPFAYGKNDCALFAAGAVEAVTGARSTLRDLRYSTFKGGLRQLRRLGFADHIAAAAAHFTEVPVAMAWPGDLAVIETADGPALSVVQGEAIYVLGEAGLGLVPLLTATRAFRVI